jgi:hypothetical protein
MAHLAILTAKPRYTPSHKRQYWPASTDITGNVITPRSTAHRQFPTKMLQAVLDKSTGQLMEMCHLLINLKYKELWGKLFTKELAHFPAFNLSQTWNFDFLK